MGLNISKDCKLAYVLAPTTGPGTSTGQDSAEVDLSGFDSCCFVACLGATTAANDGTFTVSVYGSTASGSGYQVLSSPAAVTTTTGVTDEAVYMEIKNSNYRYLKCRIARNTASSTHGGIVAVLYDGNGKSVTHSTTIAGGSFAVGGST